MPAPPGGKSSSRRWINSTRTVRRPPSSWCPAIHAAVGSHSDRFRSSRIAPSHFRQRSLRGGSHSARLPSEYSMRARTSNVCRGGSGANRFPDLVEADHVDDGLHNGEGHSPQLGLGQVADHHRAQNHDQRRADQPPPGSTRLQTLLERPLTTGWPGASPARRCLPVGALGAPAPHLVEQFQVSDGRRHRRQAPGTVGFGRLASSNSPWSV